MRPVLRPPPPLVSVRAPPATARPVFAAPIYGTSVAPKSSDRHRLPDLLANDFARNNQFHPAILLAPGGRLVGRHRLSFSKTLRSYRRARHSLFGQVVTHGCAAVFRKLLVVIIAADAVGIAFHRQSQTRMARDDSRHLGELLASGRPERVLGRVEQ